MTRSRPLGEDLAELERTDPVVHAAADRLAEALDRLALRAEVPVTRFRKSTPDHPCEVLR